jgi:hypothetical protein
MPGSPLEHFYKKHSDSCERGRTLLCPDQSARGLAQSKTLARMAITRANAKRLGLRWPSTAFFSPQDMSPQHFSENKSPYDLWQRSKEVEDDEKSF